MFMNYCSFNLLKTQNRHLFVEKIKGNVMKRHIHSILTGVYSGFIVIAAAKLALLSGSCERNYFISIYICKPQSPDVAKYHITPGLTINLTEYKKRSLTETASLML